ncbi:MAG: hypothetical protein AVDCRST_MAG22-1225, partial [uncultured Rubrobacteraceae bacterium]
ALAAGGDLPRDTQAPGIRDAEAVDGVGDPKDHPGAFGPVLGGHLVRPSADGAGGGCLQAGGLVPQGPSDFRRRFGVGAKGAVGPRGADFLRVARTDRHGKSPAGLRGTPNRGGLLRSL